MVDLESATSSKEHHTIPTNFRLHHAATHQTTMLLNTSTENSTKSFKNYIGSTSTMLATEKATIVKGTPRSPSHKLVLLLSPTSKLPNSPKSTENGTRGKIALQSITYNNAGDQRPPDIAKRTPCDAYHHSLQFTVNNQAIKLLHVDRKRTESWRKLHRLNLNNAGGKPSALSKEHHAVTTSTHSFAQHDRKWNKSKPERKRLTPTTFATKKATNTVEKSRYHPSRRPFPPTSPTKDFSVA